MTVVIELSWLMVYFLELCLFKLAVEMICKPLLDEINIKNKTRIKKRINIPHKECQSTSPHNMGLE